MYGANNLKMFFLTFIQLSHMWAFDITEDYVYFLFHNVE
jgi:hypothetical protein